MGGMLALQMVALCAKPERWSCSASQASLECQATPVLPRRAPGDLRVSGAQALVWVPAAATHSPWQQHLTPACQTRRLWQTLSPREFIDQQLPISAPTIGEAARQKLTLLRVSVSM